MPSVSWLRSARRVERSEEEAEVRHRERVLDRLDREPILGVDGAVVRGERASISGERTVLLTHLVNDVVARLEQARGWLGEAVDDAGHQLRCS